ncbi:MAG: diguanylate cyclase [Desulfuromonadales bacterium]|nr:diguanylate cyclase [Desulfuromonadales bacterium]
MHRSVLVIDDSKTTRQQILEILAKTSLFSQQHAAGGVLEGFKVVIDHPVDLIICDLEMPGMDGFKFLSLLNAREELRDIPVIMLTGREDLETKIRGLEQGASDYVTKPFDPGELVARIKVQMKIKSLRDSLKESNQRLTELSNTDPLTGLSNRRCLMETLEREIQRSRRGGSTMSMIMADIDFFKKINDTYGHQVGDEVIKTVADLLRSHLRSYDLAARFGGEEFVLVLPGSSLVQAVQAAERIRTAASLLSFPPPAERLRLTISLGVATYPRGRIESVDDLVREADSALYKAKGEGRNRVAVVDIGAEGRF